jgi:hypothetical protein
MGAILLDFLEDRHKNVILPPSPSVAQTEDAVFHHHVLTRIIQKIGRHSFNQLIKNIAPPTIVSSPTHRFLDLPAAL